MIVVIFCVIFIVFGFYINVIYFRFYVFILFMGRLRFMGVCDLFKVV